MLRARLERLHAPAEAKVSSEASCEFATLGELFNEYKESCVSMLAFILMLGSICPLGRGQEKRAVSVGDAIALTRLADPRTSEEYQPTERWETTPRRESLRCRSEERRSIHELEYIFDLLV